jgi:CBS domain-containing protein
MQLKDVMTRDVAVVRPEATLQEAAGHMKALDVGVIPVCDGEHLMGMLTDRDITVRATATGRDPRTTHVRDVMTPDVVYCFEDQDMAEAQRLMQERQIRRLLILNRDKRLAGVVSLGDLAVKAGADKVGGAVLERVSEPAQPKR